MPRKNTPKRRAYDTGLSDGQWGLIEAMTPAAQPGGRQCPTAVAFVAQGAEIPFQLIARCVFAMKCANLRSSRGFIHPNISRFPHHRAGAP